MAETRTPEEVKREIKAQREELADAVDALRSDLKIGKKLKSKLPAIAAGALGAGFVLGGGIRATMRLIGRRRHN